MSPITISHVRARSHSAENAYLYSTAFLATAALPGCANIFPSNHILKTGLVQKCAVWFLVFFGEALWVSWRRCAVCCPCGHHSCRRSRLHDQRCCIQSLVAAFVSGDARALGEVDVRDAHWTKSTRYDAKQLQVCALVLLARCMQCNIMHAGAYVYRYVCYMNTRIHLLPNQICHRGSVTAHV